MIKGGSNFNQRSKSPNPNMLGRSLNKVEVNKKSNEMFLEKLEKELGNESKNKTTMPTGKPLALFCYLCGKEYGSSSLEIHLKTCKTAYVKNKPNADLESLKPDSLDSVMAIVKSKGQMDLALLGEYNKAAEKIYREENFVGCPNCGRKFLPDRLEVHLKGCKGNSIKGNTKGNTNTISKDNTTMKKGNRSSSVSHNQVKNKSTQLFEEKLEKQMKEEKSSPKKSFGNTNAGFTPNKPLFLVCFICGREFGKHSIEFHLKSCIDKSNSSDKSKIKIPVQLQEIFAKLSSNEEPSLPEITNYNETAEKIFKEKTMKSCPGCQRKFLPDRLEVHLKSCKPYKENPSNKQSSGPKMTSRPQMHMCPLCGREFGSMSLPIHMNKCKEAFEREQMMLPYNERRSADKIIDKYNEAKKSLKSNGEYNLESMNNGAYEIWSKDALVPCENCGRTFLPDRLIVHLRSCKGK